VILLVAGGKANQHKENVMNETELIKKTDDYTYEVDRQLALHAAECVVMVSDGCYWALNMTPENAAQFLAERSHHVLLHVEPVEIKGDEVQNLIRRLYFESGGEKEVPLCDDDRLITDCESCKRAACDVAACTRE